jgi:ribonuclease D
MTQRAAANYTSIQNNRDLEAACGRLSKASRLAIDTEFVGEKYYYSKLELVQLSDGNEVVLVDMQAITDLAPLSQLLGNVASLKLFHASSQDLVLIERVLGVKPLPFFDTQIAASLLGFGAQISLGNLISALLDVEISSKHSTSDWSHRPLSPEQFAYAANDVLYLHRLHDRLSSQLQQRGRTPWYDDEIRLYTEDTFSRANDSEDELYRRVKDWSSLSSKELAILRELAKWREETARTENVPRRTVVTDEGLIEMARFQPDTREKAQKLRRVNVGQLMRYFNQLQECLRRGRAIPRDQWPQKPLPTRTDIPTGLMELCLALLRTEAERQEVASSVIATTSQVEQLIIHRAELSEKDSFPLLHGWRREVAGARILDLLQGRVAVTVAPDGQLCFKQMNQ